MIRIFAAATLALAFAAHAQDDCKKQRPLSKPEQAFYERLKGTAKSLPPAPQGWELHPEEISIPTQLCADADPMLKKGDARLNVVTEAEYRDHVDHTPKVEQAMKLGSPSGEEAKRSAELGKKLEALKKAAPDAGTAAQVAAAAAELQKISKTQTERVNAALHEASLDAQARVRLSFNPVAENTTGCSYQKTVTATTIPGATQAFLGTCDLSSAPQEPEHSVLLLLGPWKVKADGGGIEATSTFNPKKPASTIQTISVVILGDGNRPDELLKGLDLKAIAALVGK